MIRIFLARVIATYRKAFRASGNKSVIITTGRSNPLNLQMDSTSTPAPSPPNGFKSKAQSRPIFMAFTALYPTITGSTGQHLDAIREEAPDFSGASSSSVAIWRRRADSNRRIEVLQTPALSHLATSPFIFDCDSII